MGSRRTGPALAMASRKASDPAILKLISEESTAWNLPSKHGDLDVDDGVPEDAAGGHGLDDALLHGRDVLPGDGTAHDLVDEVEALAPLEGLDPQRGHAELAVAAGLLLVLALRPRPAW